MSLTPFFSLVSPLAEHPHDKNSNYKDFFSDLKPYLDGSMQVYNMVGGGGVSCSPHVAHLLDSDDDGAALASLISLFRSLDHHNKQQSPPPSSTNLGLGSTW
ncbi:unnamed protein product, partial [Ilex paraguariensis]